MKDDKKFYWIKLKDTFLNSDTVDYLMSQKNGSNYVVLYQMLCLKTVNTDGVLARKFGEMIVPFDVEKIQRDTKFFDVDTVRVALELFKNLGLIYENENGLLRISDYENLVGNESKWAKIKRNQRKTEQIEHKEDSGQCPQYVHDMSLDLSTDIIGHSLKNVHIEKEKEKDKRNIKEKKENLLGSSKPNAGSFDSQVIEVLEYLNSLKGSAYRNTDSSTKHLRARLKEGYTVKEIKKVVLSKFNEWMNDDKMFKYVRPTTLFSKENFENYLQEIIPNNPVSENEESIRVYDPMTGEEIII